MYKLELILENKTAREIKALLIEDAPELRGSDLDTLSELTSLLFQGLLEGHLKIVPKNLLDN